MARPGLARRGTAWRGKAGLGKAWRGKGVCLFSKNRQYNKMEQKDLEKRFKEIDRKFKVIRELLFLLGVGGLFCSIALIIMGFSRAFG